MKSSGDGPPPTTREWDLGIERKVTDVVPMSMPTTIRGSDGGDWFSILP